MTEESGGRLIGIAAAERAHPATGWMDPAAERTAFGSRCSSQNDKPPIGRVEPVFAAPTAFPGLQFDAQACINGRAECQEPHVRAPRTGWKTMIWSLLKNDRR